MQYMHDLVRKTVEVLALWRLLLHHQLHVIFDALEKVGLDLSNAAFNKGI